MSAMLFQKLFALDAVALGSRDVPFAACWRSVLQNRSSRKERDWETIEWADLGQVDPEMEDKYGQNPIQTAKIFAAADARDCAEADATSASHSSRRSAEEAYPADARALWFAHRGARDQSQRGVRLGENEGIE